ncbi:hypothetical protein N7510_011080 [Penicillium lagena]|uniref:uncharacterized protein n=1 Tax=Penicillium lagena TaxID=94218 RepID=UPI002540E359|nr:uncharacterized protein N7510_011080 [Penicillium lagena]KAJ5601546.1 hypothetical protein N7510_011080 [Penicillium lagena]
MQTGGPTDKIGGAKLCFVRVRGQGEIQHRDQGNTTGSKNRFNGLEDPRTELLHEQIDYSVLQPFGPKESPT